MTVEGDQARFDAERRRLTALAYRMTGTPDDADDVVQEVWIRWQRTDRSVIDNEAAWLTTVTTRVAIDRLTSAQARRELYVGPWVPEPMADSSLRGTSVDPAEVVASSDSLTLGFLRVLETLDPTERAVFPPSFFLSCTTCSQFRSPRLQPRSIATRPPPVRWRG